MLNRIAVTYSTKQAIFYILVIVVTLHWLACLWSGLAMFSAPQRTDALTEAVAAAMEGGDLSCTGCATSQPTIESDPDGYCTSDCLTECEVRELATLENVGTGFIVNQETWVCRSQSSGLVRGDWGRSWELWVFAMVVALGQLSGGAIMLSPANTYASRSFSLPCSLCAQNNNCLVQV